MIAAYHGSDAYARMLGVSIVSLFDNNKDMDSITVYVIERGISPENKNALNLIAEKYGRHIEYITMPDVNELEKLQLKKVKKKWIFDSYCRLYLDDLLPETVEKVLYLDSDVLVTDSLKSLWDTDLSGHLAAAVKDCLNKKYYKLLGLKDGAHYCNSGVILVNLAKWRKENVGDAIRQYVHDRNGYVFYMEQTVMNGVIQDKWLILPARYNVNTLMMALSYDQLKTLRKIDDFYSEEETKEAVEHPALIHTLSTFLVPNRVWIKGTNHPAKPIYDKYKRMTVWADAEDLPDTRSSLMKLVYFIIGIVPKPLMLTAVGFVYNYIRVPYIRHVMKKYSNEK